MKINSRVTEPFRSIFIMAEVASAHDGDVKLAMKIADAVSTTGADAIKFQIFNTDSLLVPEHHKYNAFKQIEMDKDKWREVINYARSLGLFVVVEVFDRSSFELAEKLDISVYKIPTSDLTNPFLLNDIACVKKTLILPLGGATEEEVDFAVSTCEKAGNRELILMHGFQSFPTRIEDTNFRKLQFLSKKYPYETGFADHVDADCELAVSLPLVAIGYGVSVIEKHITIDRSEKGRDYYSSLNPDEFAGFVSQVRQVEKTYANDVVGLSEPEIAYRDLMKKKVVAKSDIAENSMITKDNIVFKRTDDSGILPNEYSKVLGKARHFISAHSAIREEDVG